MQGARVRKRWVAYFVIIVAQSIWLVFVPKKIKNWKESAEVDNLLQGPYLQRMVNMKQRCKQRHFDYASILSKHFKFDDSLKLVMCENPKVASTTWQILFLKLGGFKKEIKQKMRKEWEYHEIPNKYFEQLDSEGEALRRLSEYTTFFAMRHPFERLVSAYVGKFSSKSRWNAYKQREGRKIAESQLGSEIYGINTHWLSKTPTPLILRSPAFLKLSAPNKKQMLEKIFVLKSGEISFQQFVNYIVDNYQSKEQIKTMDHHWIPQVYNCMPCYVNYSFVIRFESLSTDSQYLLNYLQRKTTTNLTFPLTGPPQTSQNITQKMFQLLPEQQVDKLRKIYADDFYVFDYDLYLYQGYKGT